jgi:GlcNAc-P-P-Und epimerase
MKVLVLGSTGNLGQYIINYFKELDNSDLIIDGLSTKDCDLNNITDVKRYFKNKPDYDSVIFLVGLAHSKGKKKDFEEFKKINFTTLVNFLSTLKSLGKLPQKIIFASSISIYGEKYDSNYYEEDSPKSPESPYAITKLMAENYLMENYSKSSWILRFTPVYSENFSLNIDRRIKVNNFYFRVGKGDNTLSLCNINNIGILVTSLLSGKVPSGYYNIGDDYKYKFNDLLNDQDANFIFFVPRILVYILYKVSIFFDNIFLKENSIKLLTNNYFPVDKINKFIKLKYILKNVN